VQRRLWPLVLAAALGAAASTACREAGADAPVRRSFSEGGPRTPARSRDISIARDSEIVRTLVPARTTLAALLQAHDVARADAAAMIARIAERFDLRRVRAGQSYVLDRFFDGRIREFVYEVDADRRLIARRAASGEPDFEAGLEEIPKSRKVVTIEGRISRETPSLIEAMEAAEDGLPRVELALALADVFSGEVDFNNDLQPDDSFRLVVERATRDDGQFGGYGPVMAAELVNDGRRLRALRFTLPEGKPGYYDEHGRSLKRFLLKSPLKFDPRITSGFSRSRRHPVLNYRRAHNGVDYAASTGAPVVAVASGIVTFAGWTGGGGRTVKLRHASGYESEYLHMSSIATGIRAGARVGQGELVGRVGATGLVTGPHLHYGLKRNGSYVNPVREHLNMPPGEPVPAVHVALFAAERDRLFAQLSNPSIRRAN
jgi:murein DD-endopeptidase MepM/ murein hydrolase activator NlpD